MVGQIWECQGKIGCGIYNKGHQIKILDHVMHVDAINFHEDVGDASISTNFLKEHFTFVPQTDLEWLAVNYKWSNEEIKSIHKVADDDIREWDHKDFDYVTRQQWQDKRYELGLDEVQNYSGCKVINNVEIGTVFGEQKEPKIIDLSMAKVEDKFDWSGDNMEGVKLNGLAKLEYITPNGFYVFYCGSGEIGILIVVDEYGIGVYTGKQQSFTKHDPRHWMKDLPDADLFNDGWLSLNRSNGWLWSIREPVLGLKSYSLSAEYLIYDISFLKMPTLIADEWELSKISIPDLKAWQEANKCIKK